MRRSERPGRKAASILTMKRGVGGIEVRYKKVLNPMFDAVGGRDRNENLEQAYHMKRRERGTEI